MYSFTASAEREIAPDVKENVTYNGLDYDTEHKSISESDITSSLTDIISVGAGRFHRVAPSAGIFQDRRREGDRL